MNDRDFRLSKDVMPVRYALRIEADLDAWQFRGSADIDVTVKRPTASVTLHALDLTIAGAVVEIGGAERPATVTGNPVAETVTLQPAAPLQPGSARLRLQFSGAIIERLRGFYRSHKDGARYAATQFEAADARRAFPCFDEPEFKARFALTLVVPDGVTAIANGAVRHQTSLPEGRTEIVFAETPPISTYLVAYCVGPFDATPAAQTPSGVPVRVFLPRGMADKGIYARDAHARSLTYLEDYTGIPYPYGKVDAIGVPDFEAGAMENPGAITYRLTAIAADPERTSVHALKGIFYTAAHELTHMWWGDLVTMAWWDDLWLNESFATFVGYKAVAELMPEWGLWRDFVATLARPFALDALVSTHPISFEVKNAKQATERFDVITYWKGAGVVRMIEGFLGAEAFRAGVRTYLGRYRESNATADDFWRELTTASRRDVATIADAWIKTPGHPVVHVGATQADDGLRLTLRQERFFADAEASRNVEPQVWPVPMIFACGGPGGVREERVLLTAARAEVTLRGARWCFPNGGGTGFYRFTMDDAAFAALLGAVPEALAPHERLNLVDNQWALLRAGKVSVEQFFRLVDAYRGETDRAVFAALADHLAWLGLHAVGDGARTAFERYVCAYYEPVLTALGWDPQPEESADDRMKRAAVLGALGLVARAPAVRVEARHRLERYLDDRRSLDPNLASAVAGIAARDGDAELYDRYLERKRSASTDPEEEQRFLLALAAFEPPALIRRTLDLVLTGEVRAQDRPFLLAGLLGRRASREHAWSFVRDRWQELAALMDPMLVQNLIRALGQLTAEPTASEVRTFLPPRATEETRETIAQVSELLAIDSATVRRLTPALATWLGQAIGGR
ncbi:ERAP1-like C-terminal domain-containing protein [Candidatus Binatia bacterium]|nr:ERAP1-like C-terminal domain-containing protein [Candidatus Binatia bacterium]